MCGYFLQVKAAGNVMLNLGIIGLTVTCGYFIVRELFPRYRVVVFIVFLRVNDSNFFSLFFNYVVLCFLCFVL